MSNTYIVQDINKDHDAHSEVNLAKKFPFEDQSGFCSSKFCIRIFHKVVIISCLFFFNEVRGRGHGGKRPTHDRMMTKLYRRHGVIKHDGARAAWSLDWTLLK